jgi:hypothetical protein
MIRINHNPSRRYLAVFALLWLGVFCVLGGMSWWRSGACVTANMFWAIAVAIPVLGLIWPGALRLVYLAISYATYPIGLVVSYIILAIVYYLVLTPIGIVMRVTGYDPMHRNFDRSAKTYWIPRETEEGTERYFKQF